MDLKSAINPIDAAGTVKATLSNLSQGWGYTCTAKKINSVPMSC